MVCRFSNGASKFHGQSLNKSLFVGPNVLQKKLRQHQSNVIEATFLHYFVRPRDEPSLRFLWRKDATSDVKSFLYTRYIFGARVSTTCANFALQQTAMDNNECFPKAFKAVLSTSTRMVTRFHSKKTITQWRSKDLVILLKLWRIRFTKFVMNI